MGIFVSLLKPLLRLVSACLLDIQGLWWAMVDKNGQKWSELLGFPPQ